MATPNCQRCRHFYVTWQPASPRGCKAYGFMSRQWPTEVVKASSGHDCSCFEEKKKPPRKRREENR